jgi:predicted Zn finger-like uncharacterized protein
MYTRCPKCETVLSLNAASLAHTRGLVQCGQCSRTFSALSFLFDEWPSGRAQAPAEGPDVVPPVLRRSIKPAGVTDNSALQSGKPDDTKGKSKRLTWGLATALLLVLTIANITWTFRKPLSGNPAISDLMEETDLLPIEQDGLLKDPVKIQLVSRDMHTHPTRSGILVLSLTFVNLAQRNQVFPELEVTLLDATNQPVARRRLQPTDYLRPGADLAAGLAADVYLPVLLELGDPGVQAVGFEIRFL